ncbi:hypothetical protein PR202_gb25572 [Eleusine coracana subsp. coracana]|uniref:MATH domain-containing protein n=1 Tax=Eleusine coracana subsp. coracana TaxID=191504 RepID=A0AAV5FLZ9_ELECO|nr:hypothetical protein PR202_gb25572 [Eleusine coracana subsp. coracana]
MREEPLSPRALVSTPSRVSQPSLTSGPAVDARLTNHRREPRLARARLHPSRVPSLSGLLWSVSPSTSGLLVVFAIAAAGGGFFSGSPRKCRIQSSEDARAVAAAVSILLPICRPQHLMADSRTSSMCTSDKVQGTHSFDVYGYSLHRGMGIGKYITSGVFSVGGFDWAIQFYLDGSLESRKDYISVFLELLSNGAVMRASCDLRLVGLTTGLPSSMYKTETTVFNRDASFTAPQEGDFKKRSEVEVSSFLRDDYLRLTPTRRAILKRQIDLCFSYTVFCIYFKQ